MNDRSLGPFIILAALGLQFVSKYIGGCCIFGLIFMSLPVLLASGAGQVLKKH